eukprot:1158039-Pelagomonas_calceolata.AAC.8
MQASLLSTLAPLQHLTSLTLCLLDLQAFPLHTQGQGPDVQDTSENEGGKCSAGELTSLLLCGEQPNFVFSSESSDISNVPTLVDADDGPDVDVDLEEAQHASHEAPDVESLLPLARSLRVLRLEHCVMRHRTLDQLCRYWGLFACKHTFLERSLLLVNTLAWSTACSEQCVMLMTSLLGALMLMTSMLAWSTRLLGAVCGVHKHICSEDCNASKHTYLEDHYAYEHALLARKIIRLWAQDQQVMQIAPTQLTSSISRVAALTAPLPCWHCGNVKASHFQSLLMGQPLH